jgi:hypothetical protein
MAITYPVDRENTRWALYRQSTGEIVDRNMIWPEADGNPVPGLDPDFVFLLQSEDTRPEYDGRLYRLVSTETVDVAENSLRTTHAPQKRPLPERKTAADNTAAEQFFRHFASERVALDTALALGIVIAFTVDGASVPPRFRTFLDKYKDRVQAKILPNYDRLLEIVAQIEADEDPDLDAGWTEPDAE